MNARRSKIFLHSVWISLTLIFWIIQFLCIPKEFYDLGGDSAQYIILAESVSQGKGFRMINYPGEPFSFYYPPVFPLLLSPIIYFFGRNFYLMHLLVAFLGYLSLFFLYRIFKKYSSKKISIVTIVFFALNWAFILYSSNYILSDIPYLFLSSFTLVMAAYYIEKPSFLNKEGILVVFGLILSYFTRYVGLTLFLGLLITLVLINKEAKLKKIAFIGGIFLSVFIIWHILRILNPDYLTHHFKQLFLINPYAPYKGSLFAHPIYFILRFIEGVNYYCRLLPEVFFFRFIKHSVFLKESLSILIIGLTLLGLWYKFQKNKECVFHYYFLLYLLLIFFWPFKEGIRFVLPILPFIFFYFFAGLERILGFLTMKVAYPFFLILICSFFIFNILSLQVLFTNYSIRNLPRGFKNFMSLLSWAKDNLHPEAIVLSRKPTVTYFYTGHKAIGYPFTLNSKEIWKEIIKNNVKYIIVDEFSKETLIYLVPFLHKYHDKLVLLRRKGNTGIFKIK
jgi:4-amino-4-deoxy-L-arabinose transferase-like glycosyltransferase